MIAALLAAAAVFVAGWRGAAGLQRSCARRHDGAATVGEPRHRRLRRRDAGPGEHDAADWCERAARSVRSGRSLTAAIVEATADCSSMAPTVGPMIFHLDRGHSMVEAIESRGGTDPATPAGFALSVLRTCAELGGPAAAPLERAAATLRSRAAIAEEQQVHSAQARLSARVLTLVPVGLLAVLAVAEPDVRGALGSTAGLAAVTVGGALNGAGWLWMQRIIGTPR